jgi:hypothetical protein
MPLGYSHHRASERSVDGLVIAWITVTAAGVEVKAGSEILAGRRKVYVVNDSSKLIYLGDTPGFDPASGSLICFSGEAIGFELSPNRVGGPFRLWAKTDEGTTTIRAAEVK